jgi:ABC-type branched-subunit amino acid transport system permease subunit
LGFITAIILASIIDFPALRLGGPYFATGIIVLGGAGTLIGPIIAAFFIGLGTLLGEMHIVLFGGIFVLVVIFLPGGDRRGTTRNAKALFRNRRYRVFRWD